MIISKTPLRMSFVGGGSDMPSFYREHGGAVLSSAIDAFVYIAVKKKFDEGIRLSYSKTENVMRASDLEHPIARNILQLTQHREPIEIISIADIPSSGSGLGSSSSFTVGLLNAVNALNEIEHDSRHIAELACHVEIELCGSPIGKQDQYAASCGGLKYYKFNADNTVDIEDVKINATTATLLDNEIISFYVGGNRSANKILAEQEKELKNKDKIQSMKKMVELAHDLKTELENNNVDNFGKILHENWLLKKGMTNNIANEYIDNIYSHALSCGATGGKLLGAGGGGFMIFHVPSAENRRKLIKNFNNLRKVDFKLYNKGSEIIKIV
jgi:D-glycero-alpha-D-manno-heptose-7-phosphate kinase